MVRQRFNIKFFFAYAITLYQNPLCILDLGMTNGTLHESEGRGFIQCEHFSDKERHFSDKEGEESFFRNFMRTSFMDGPLCKITRIKARYMNASDETFKI